MGFANDEEIAYRQGAHVAKELKYAGIDICYAPVLDVSYDRVNGVPVVDNRMFYSKPQVIADMGTGFIKGLEENGIAACGKHFPGMRPTHMEMVSVGDIAIISDFVINVYCFKEQIDTIKYIRDFCPTKKIIGIATRSPEDAKLLAEYCDYVIVTCGLTQVTLDALVEAIFGDGDFEFNSAKQLF